MDHTASWRFGDKQGFLFISFAVLLTQKEGGKGYLGPFTAVLPHCRMILREVFLTALGVRSGVAGYFFSHLLLFLLEKEEKCFMLQSVRLSP